jgi:hypothetical protein
LVWCSRSSQLDVGVNVVLFLFSLHCMTCVIIFTRLTMTESSELSQRRVKSKSRAALISAVTLLFGISTFSWASTWAAPFCENGYYFDAAGIGLADRQMDGRLVSSVITFVNNTIFAAQVSHRKHISRKTAITMLKLLVGDALVIWRTWALWQYSWQWYLPVGLWVSSLSA